MYTINDLATMTGLSTRTIRNYIKLGLLDGEKADGVWQFSEEQFSAFISNPNVKPTLEAKDRGIVFDFLANNKKSVNSLCVVLDLNADLKEADSVSRFFCGAANQMENIRFSFHYENGNARVILTGPEDCIQSILVSYYG